MSEKTINQITMIVVAVQTLYITPVAGINAISDLLNKHEQEATPT